MGRRTLLLIASILVAAVGTALIGLYVRGADERARQTEGMVQALVATAPIPAGSSVQEALDAIQLDDVQAKMAVNGIQGADAKAELADYLRTRTVLTPILERQVITKEMFGGPGAAATTGITNDRAVAVELTDPARVAGLLVPGSQVTVYLIPNPDDNNDIKQPIRIPVTGDDKGVMTLNPPLKLPVIVETARVLGIGNQRVGSSSSAANSGATTGAQADDVPRTIVTLDLSRSDADKVVSAQAFGELYFAVHKAS